MMLGSWAQACHVNVVYMQLLSLLFHRYTFSSHAAAILSAPRVAFIVVID